MDLANEEKRVVHGLRDRASGRMLRVSCRTDWYGDHEERHSEDVHTLSLDPEDPVFDAGSPGTLALAFAPASGNSPSRPRPGLFQPDDVEPVLVEEIVTRSARPCPVAFDVAVRLPTSGAIDVRRSYADAIEGLGAVLDAVTREAVAVKATRSPDGDYAWGSYAFVGFPITAEPGDLPEDAIGRIAIPDGAGFSLGRRILAVLPWNAKDSADRRRDEPVRGLVVCLSDTRPLPESLAEELRALRGADAPAPR